MLTTAEAAALATERGYPVKARTVKQWCLRARKDGRFVTEQIGEGKGSRWLIERASFEAFVDARRSVGAQEGSEDGGATS
jgi:hypothetical protein